MSHEMRSRKLVNVLGVGLGAAGLAVSGYFCATAPDKHAMATILTDNIAKKQKVSAACLDAIRDREADHILIPRGVPRDNETLASVADEACSPYRHGSVQIVEDAVSSENKSDVNSVRIVSAAGLGTSVLLMASIPVLALRRRRSE